MLQSMRSEASQPGRPGSDKRATSDRSDVSHLQPCSVDHQRVVSARLPQQLYCVVMSAQVAHQAPAVHRSASAPVAARPYDAVRTSVYCSSPLLFCTLYAVFLWFSAGSLGKHLLHSSVLAHAWGGRGLLRKSCPSSPGRAASWAAACAKRASSQEQGSVSLPGPSPDVSVAAGRHPHRDPGKQGKRTSPLQTREGPSPATISAALLLQATQEQGARGH